jgi:hypothetical protein
VNLGKTGADVKRFFAVRQNFFRMAFLRRRRRRFAALIGDIRGRALTGQKS